VVGERGTTGRPILFYGHMDTVPVYGQWQGSPFEPREDGDLLYGLGACDMKAGLAAILFACRQETERRIKVVFGVDEENDSAGAHAVVNSGFVKDCEVGICTEIATSGNNAIGPRAITLGRRGRCMLEIIVPGKSSHGASLEHGVNAITEASKLAIELEKMNGNLGSHELLPAPTQFVRTFSSDSGSLSVPDIAILNIDRHMVVPETPESILETMQNFIDGLYERGIFTEIDGRRITVRIKPRDVPYLMPYVTSSDNPHAVLISDIVRTQLGEPVYNYGRSVADENIFSNAGIPMISIGPKGGNEHSANEWVSKSSYLQLIEVLKAYLAVVSKKGC